MRSSVSKSRLSLAAVALAASAGLLASCAATPLPPIRPAGQVLHVDVVGDSLTRQSSTEIQTRINTTGLTGSVASMPGQDQLSPFATAALDTAFADNGDILVIATATNDAVTEAKNLAGNSADAVAQAYRATVANNANRFANRCVVFVNARENVSPIYYPAQAAVLNTELNDEKALHANMVVVDWANISRNHPEWFVADQLHFGLDVNNPVSNAGTIAYANAVNSGVQDCVAMLHRAA